MRSAHKFEIDKLFLHILILKKTQRLLLIIMKFRFPNYILLS